MTHLLAIAAVYIVVGFTSIFYFSLRRIGRRGWRLPVLCVRWEKQGLVDIVIGLAYAMADYFVHVGVLAP